MSSPSTPENPVRIALFLPNLEGGGAERALVTLANHYAKQGLIVDFLVGDAHGQYLAALDPAVNLINLSIRRIFFSVPRVMRYLRQHQPAALLSTIDKVNICAIAAVKLSGVKTRVIARLSTNLVSLMREPLSLQRRLMLALIPFFYRRADKIVSVSQGSADAYIQIAKDAPAHVEVIYNPIDFAMIDPKKAQPVTHAWFQDKTMPTLLAVGRLDAVKDYPMMLRAVKRVQDSLPCRLVILGTGAEHAALAALITEMGLTDRVDLAGFTDNPYAYMANADALLLSSMREGLPNVLIEGLACGCPIVSTDCESGPDEILEGGRWGALVPVGDSDAFADAIINTLRQPRDKNTLRERAAYFELSTIAARYLDVMLPGTL